MKPISQLDTLKWFCIKTQPKKERLVSIHLKKLDLDVFNPLIRFKKRKNKEFIWVTESMFPGYIFVKINLGKHKRIVSYSHGVQKILSFNNTYVSILDDTIKQMKNNLDEYDSIDTSIPFQVGDETSIIQGSLKGTKVQIISLLPAHQRVAVLLDLLGTSVKLELPVDSLKENRIGSTCILSD